MLQEQVISVNFGMGVDTKTDPKMVVSGKLTLLQDATLSEPKKAKKRPGFDSLSISILGGGSLVSPKMVRSYRNELICQDQGSLYSYSPQLQVWVNRGPYTSAQLSNSFVWKETSIGGYVDTAFLNGLILYTWQGSFANAQGGLIPIYAAVADAATGTFLIAPTVVGNLNQSTFNLLGSSQPRAFALGSTSLAMSYYNQSMDLVMRIFTVSGASITMGAELTIDSQIDFLTTVTAIPYDVATTSTGAVFTYVQRSTGAFTGLITATVDTSGTITHTATITDANVTGPFYLSVDSNNGNIWLYWAGSSGGAGTLKYAIYGPALSVILATTSIATGIGTAAGITQLCVFNTSIAGQTVLYSYFNSSGGLTIDATNSVGVQFNGTVSSSSPFVSGVRVLSKSAFIGTTPYAVFYYQGGNNGAGFASPTVHTPTFFLLNLLTGVPAARFFAGDAVGTVLPAGGGNLHCSPNITVLSATKVLFGCAASFQFLAIPESNLDVFGIVGAAAVQFDFGSPNTYISKQSNELLIMNGALLSAYDGKTSAELGFHLSPEILNITQSSSGGNIGTGNYQFAAVWQWTDSQGNLHQSGLSNIGSVTVASGTTNSITISCTCPYLSQKANIQAVFFRTQSNGTVFFQVSSPISITPAPASGFFLSFTDTTVDASLPGNIELYTTGDVLENSPPPPATVLESHNKRLFLVDDENRNTIWPSKSFNPGNGLGFSPALQLQIDPKFGDVIGLAEMDEKLVGWKSDHGLFYVTGDAGNDTGAGATFSFPQFIPSDVALSDLKSLILIPRGVMFKTPKGIYLLDRALNVRYYDEGYDGAAVNAFVAQKIRGATLLQSINQVRFLTDSGFALVYDYVLNQWSTFTNHQGYSADIWSTAYVYARTDGKIFKENPTKFLDDTTPYRVRAQTAWLKLGSVQGFQRVRRVANLGDYANGSNAGHGVQISAAYDFNPTFSTPIAYTFGSANTSGAFQYRERLPIQKCNAIQLLIEEVTTGDAAEYIDFNDLSFEVGIKRGLNKLPAARSIG